MQNRLISVLFILLPTLLWGQVDTRTLKVDSLKRELANAKTDTARVLIYEKLIWVAPTNKLAIDYASRGLVLAKRNRYTKGTILCGNGLGFCLIELDYYRAIPILMETKQFCERENNQFELVRTLGYLGYAYDKFDFQKAMYYYTECRKLMQKTGVSENVSPINMAIGLSYKDHGSLDSALVYLQKGYDFALKSPVLINPNWLLVHFGTIYYRKGQKDMAMRYFRRSISASAQEPDGQVLDGIARIYRDRNQLDSARFYARKALQLQQDRKRTIYIIESANLLVELYQTSDPAQALRYYRIASATKDSLFSQDKARQVEKLAYEERERESRTQRRIEAHQLALQSQIRFYSVLGILGLVVLAAFMLYRNNRQKQRANTLLEQQKAEIQVQRDQTAQTLHQLRTTQTQLIQAEKMASLGELTAGIAHEIQNPLNFVNNFSEVSAELVEEMQDELDKGDTDEAKAIADDLKQNLQKINLHGQRASSIVKGMLEHSRASTGQREPTDLNALADEYLKLAYHGLRGKDNAGSPDRFNSDFKTDFEDNLPKIEAIPQDMGRVLLNLINNAFYAVKSVEKPLVVVKTEQADNQVIITISDNGTGMSEATKAKVFQPFFTTKPTGQGTGLGLSLAYDIVTKGHGGTLTVESLEGEGTAFMVKLPI